MSWKSIEMQVALPRVQEAGKLQEQMMKQNQHFQASLAQSQMKQEEQMRKRVNEFEEVNNVIVEEEDSNPDQNSDDQQNEASPDQSEDTTEHPFLGKKIDFSG